MGSKDDGSRGNVREKAKLKGSDPGGSYAFHDATRASGRKSKAPGQRSSNSPREGGPANDNKATPPPPKRAHKTTIAGGFQGPPAETIQVDRSASSEHKNNRWTLSDPPEIGSWPPLPNVPPDMQGAAEQLAHLQTSVVSPSLNPASSLDDDLPPTEPPKGHAAGNKKNAGAIWDAAPSRTSSAPARGRSSDAARALVQKLPSLPAIGADDDEDEDEEEHEAVTAVMRSESSEARVPTERPPAPSAEESTAAKILGSILPRRSKKPVPVEPAPEFIALRGTDETDARAATPTSNAQATAAARDRMSVTQGDYTDDSVARFETLVERGAWEQLARELMVTPNLSPTLALLHIIAKRETATADDKSAGKLTQEAITTLAGLLGVPPSSPTALVIAKRLLRRNRAWSNEQPAAGTSVGIILSGLAVGAGIGWLVTMFLL